MAAWNDALLQLFFPAAPCTCLRFLEPLVYSLWNSLYSLNLYHTAHILVGDELKFHTTFWDRKTVSELESETWPPSETQLFWPLRTGLISYPNELPLTSTFSLRWKVYLGLDILKFLFSLLQFLAKSNPYYPRNIVTKIKNTPENIAFSFDQLFLASFQQF